MGNKLEIKHVAAPRRVGVFFPSGAYMVLHGALVVLQKGGVWQPAIVSPRLKSGLRIIDPRVLVLDEATHEVLFNPREVPNDLQAAWVLKWLSENLHWPSELFQAPAATQRSNGELQRLKGREW